MQDVISDLFPAFIIERQVTRQELVGYNTKGPKVKHIVYFFPFDHFWRHIVSCAKNTIFLLFLRFNCLFGHIQSYNMYVNPSTF